MRNRGIVLARCLGALCFVANSQPILGQALAESVPPAAPTQQVVEAPAVAGRMIPALTDIVISVDADVSSSTATTGDFFPISLAQPIMLDGAVVVPAGITGQGQVVHARHRGWGGGAGELILAARYLDWNGTRIALRTMRINQAGRDGARLAHAAVAAVGPIGAFVTGRSTSVAKGQLAAARLAQDVPLDHQGATVTQPLSVPGADQAQTTNDDMQQEEKK